MALTSGTKLGPYQIQSALGAGGMGEVYRARDARLERTVAVKILPVHLSDNPGAKQRFEREARAISGLSHPNICHLYDVGSQDGINYLVMEFLEGETLADRLRKGPLPPEQVLKYGIEICEGLEKAHRSGVIHRDLKPGNIMLTKTGAKLMDFGLAKGVNPVESTIVGTNSVLKLTGGQPAADCSRHCGGNLPVHFAGATAGTGSRCALGYFFARRSVVRDGDGETCVRREDDGECDRGGIWSAIRPRSVRYNQWHRRRWIK